MRCFVSLSCACGSSRLFGEIEKLHFEKGYKGSCSGVVEMEEFDLGSKIQLRGIISRYHHPALTGYHHPALTGYLHIQHPKSSLPQASQSKASLYCLSSHCPSTHIFQTHIKPSRCPSPSSGGIGAATNANSPSSARRLRSTAPSATTAAAKTAPGALPRPRPLGGGVSEPCCLRLWLVDRRGWDSVWAGLARLALGWQHHASWPAPPRHLLALAHPAPRALRPKPSASPLPRLARFRPASSSPTTTPIPEPPSPASANISPRTGDTHALRRRAGPSANPILRMSGLLRPPFQASALSVPTCSSGISSSICSVL